MQPSHKKITVLMPVFNAQDYVAEAIRSILNQTCKDFEFLIINDGSTDASDKIIRSFTDHRIRYECNSGNIGLIATLNKGLDLATGNYIVRMDADDIAMPVRIQKQIDAFEKDPGLVLCASNYELIGGGIRRAAKTSFHGDEIKAQLLFASSISHPTVMMLNPKKFFGISYHPGYPHCEDYRLWAELSEKGSFAILDEKLLKYRVHDKQVTAIYRHQQKAASSGIRQDFLKACNLVLSNEEKVLLDRVGNHERFSDLKELGETEKLFLKLKQQKPALFGSSDLSTVLKKNWLDTCGNTGLGVSAYRFCLRSAVLKGHVISAPEKLLLLAKCLLRGV